MIINIIIITTIVLLPLLLLQRYSSLCTRIMPYSCSSVIDTHRIYSSYSIRKLDRFSINRHSPYPNCHRQTEQVDSRPLEYYYCYYYYYYYYYY